MAEEWRPRHSGWGIFFPRGGGEFFPQGRGGAGGALSGVVFPASQRLCGRTPSGGGVRWGRGIFPAGAQRRRGGVVWGGFSLRPSVSAGGPRREVGRGGGGIFSRRGAEAQGGRCRGREFSDSSFKPGSIRTRTRTQPAGRYSYSNWRRTLVC
jgi:hypothetical protein